MRSGSGGGAGGGGRSKGGKSGTGTAAKVAGVIGGAAAAPAASAPAAAAAAIGAPVPSAGLSAAAQAKQLSEEFSKVKRTTGEQRDAFDAAYSRLTAQAKGEAKSAFLASAPSAHEARVLGALDAVGKFEASITHNDVTGGLRTVSQVREFAAMPKADFDKAALSLATKGKVNLTYHDYPESLSPAKRGTLVHDPSGNMRNGEAYYAGIARPRD